STAISVQMILAPASGAGSAGAVANSVASTQGGIATFNALAPSNAAGGLCGDGTNAPCRALRASASGVSSGDSAVFHVTPFGLSTGANGPLNATTNTILAAGVYNYTTITIAGGVTVSGDGNGVLDLRATGDVTINGTLTVSGGNGGPAGVNG